MSNIEEVVRNALRQLDSPCTAVTCADVAKRLRDAIGMENLGAFGSLPVNTQAEYIAFQATELPQGELYLLCPPGSALLQTLQDFVDYWCGRAKAAQNCRLRERYAAIALQISAARSLKVNRLEVGTIQIEAAREAVAKCEPSAWSEVMPPLKRALRLALSLGQRDMATQVTEAMVVLAEKCSSTKTMVANLWPQCFDTILVEQAGKLSVSTELQNKLIIETEASFQATLESISAGVGAAFVTVAHDAKRLVDFYRREKRSADIGRTATSLQQATLKGCENISPMHIAICVQPTVQFLHDNGFPKLADELAAKMLGCLKTLPGMMQEWRFSMKIPIIEVQKEIEEICAFETSEAIRRLVLARVPPQPAGDGSSLLSANIISPQTIDESGRTTSAARSPEEAGEQIVIGAYCNALQVDWQILGFQLDEIVSRKGITGEVLAGFCVSSRAFSMDRREALRRGFAAWLHRDYAAAILFLLPQIERAVQRIVQDAARSALQPSKGDLSMDYKLLDGLLTDPATVGTLGEQCTYYLRTVLTHRAGWNVRNQVLHGWLDPCSLGRPVSDRVVHIALLLAAKTMNTDGELQS